MDEKLKPTGLIDFPKLEPSHVWLMAVLASLSRGMLTADSFADADRLVVEYKKKFGF